MTVNCFPVSPVLRACADAGSALAPIVPARCIALATSGTCRYALHSETEQVGRNTTGTHVDLYARPERRVAEARHDRPAQRDTVSSARDEKTEADPKRRWPMLAFGLPLRKAGRTMMVSVYPSAARPSSVRPLLL
jgi:hypothetical protein